MPLSKEEIQEIAEAAAKKTAEKLLRTPDVKRCTPLAVAAMTRFGFFVKGVYNPEGEVVLNPESHDQALLFGELADDIDDTGFLPGTETTNFRRKAEALASAIDDKDSGKAQKLAGELEQDAHTLITSAILSCGCGLER